MSDHKDDFLVNCLKHRNDLNWLNNLPGKDLEIKCRRFLNSIRNATDHIESNLHVGVPLQRNSSNSTIFSYLSALANWRNREGSIENLLLNYVSPCFTVSRKIKKSWKSFYSVRQKASSVVPLVYTNDWDQSNGTITLRPTTLRLDGQHLVAAELVLLRKRPNDIGESFGMYSFVASAHRGTVTHRVHASVMLSCPFGDGRFVVLDLSLPFLANWHQLRSQNLTISVTVRPRRQYFRGLRRRTLHVVNNILGLVLHFRNKVPPRQDRLVRNQLETTLNRGQTAAAGKRPLVRYIRRHRFRRGAGMNQRSNHRLRKSSRGGRATLLNSPRLTKYRQPCHLVPFVVEANTTRMFNVSWPERGKQYWDISECVGGCSPPIPYHISTTNHAILLNYESKNRVCCVPVSFDSQHYITQIDGELVVKEFPDLIATKCGCR